MSKCILFLTKADESDDELSTRVAVAISIVVTFISTLVVTALISVIITSLYYKHLFKKSVIRQKGDSHALTEDIKSNDPAYATTRANITMDTNPAWELLLPSKWILIQLMLAIKHCSYVFLLFVATFGIMHIVNM